MATIQFSHANGFPASCYQYFLNFLAEKHELCYIEKLGHGAYPIDANWESLTDELIDTIEQQQQQAVVGLGHSVGAVITLFAALKRPDLFSQIIIMEPPLFVGGIKRMVLKWAAKFRLNAYFPLVTRAKKRRTHFNSREEAYAYFKEKSLFRHFHRQCLYDYVLHGLQESKTTKGYTLSFDAAVEHQIFRHTPYRIAQTNLTIPTYFLYSKYKKVLSRSDIWHLGVMFPSIQPIQFDGGHLFPLEKPAETAAVINSLIP